MKQWLVRRGLLAAIPVAGLLVFALDACSSEPGSTANEAPKTTTATATTKEVARASDEQELVATELARSHLARVTQFSRLVKVPTDLKKGDPTAAPAHSLAAIAAAGKASATHFELEAQPVVTTGEIQRFVQRGERVHAQLTDDQRRISIRPAHVELPQTAEGFVRIQAEKAKAGVEFATVGAKAGIKLETADGLINYPAAGPHGGDMVLKVGRESIEDYVVLEKRPEHPYVDYTVKVDEVAGLRLYDNVLEFLDKDGDPQIGMSMTQVVDADGKAHHATIALPDCSADHDGLVPWGRPVTAPGASTCTVRVSWDDAKVVYPAILDPVWSTPGAMKTARFRNAATKLSSGLVLTCGGLDINGDPLKGCETFNAAGGGGVGAWTTSTTMTVARSKFTLIAIGADVLAVGDTASATSENLNAGTWTASTGDFSAGNFYLNTLQPALTSDSKYVVVIDQQGKPFVYTVATKTWTAGTTNNFVRSSYMTFPLPGSATVARCGGNAYPTAYKTCEKYTPSTDTWVMPGAPGAIADMGAARSYAAYMLVDPTHLMLYGGYNTQSNVYVATGEIYTASSNSWSTLTNNIPNNFEESEGHNSWAIHGGTGRIMTTAMYNPTVYDPVAQTWTNISNYDGSTYFYTMGPEGAIAPVANKVLVFPVSTTGSYSAQTACRLFDYVAQGGLCQADADCKSGLHCWNDTNGQGPQSDPMYYTSVCCDTTCTDPCYSCKAETKEDGLNDGTCGPRTHTLQVYYPNCKYQDPSTCGNIGSYCDGKGACTKWDSSQVCVYGTCADADTQNNQQKCDGAGNCSVQTTTDCATGYACEYQQCATSCFGDSECQTGYYCQYWAAPYNTCQPRKTGGKTCSNNSTTECASGFCVDGVCCDKACNGICEACSNALTNKTNGICNPIPAGTASGKDCFDQGSGSCGQTGLCDGARNCAKYSNSTQCNDLANCANETTRYIPDLCDGSGNCVDKGSQACGTGYSCQAGVCNTSCTSDANCASAYYCDIPNKTCVADKTNGSSCPRDAACQGNQNCVDGVCCDSACTGTCRSCLKARTGQVADGICDFILDDTDPENECPTDVGYPPSCKAPGTCDGKGTCRVYAKANTVAKPDSCGGVTLTQHSCDGAGNPSNLDIPCYPYKCNAAGTGCQVACTKGSEATDCDDSSFCQDGKCVGQKPQGAACTDGTQCKSHFCVDQHVGALEGDPPPDPSAGGDSGVDPVDHPGVCCDSACGSQCEACKKSTKGQGSDGTCGPVADHTDLKNDCPADAVNPCGHNGECDGKGNCRDVPSGTSCGVSSCVGNSARGQVCDGLGACVNDSAIACAPYVCRDVNGAQQCTNPCAEDNDCQDGYYCVDKACKKKLAPGAKCDTSAICASGFCVDSVCCDVSCKGQCEACDVAGSEGVCSPTTGVPHGMRPACDHAGDECGGQCDGVNSAVCKYAPNGTACGTPTCTNDVASSSSCDGQGSCNPNKDAECSPYACGSDETCLTKCAMDSDCGDGFSCNTTNQRCVPANASCSDDRQSSQGNGQSTPCKPFLCVPATGTCAVSCAFTTDCAPDFVCEPSTKTCLPAPADSGSGADSGSCACRAAGATPTRPAYLALAGLAVALSGLRRRRSQMRKARERAARI